MGDKAWKDHERKTARAFGGKRVGPTGKVGPDIHHKWLSIECKERKSLPAWLLDAMRQITTASSTNKLPIVVLHQLGDRHNNDLVVIRQFDFVNWFIANEEEQDEVECKLDGAPERGHG